MKPKILKIDGLNSFQQQQIIEFDRLMERGLFGIFGTTGSGKSSILDAIILSLYGNIPRNSRNFINSDLDIANVYFEFELNNNADIKTYVVERNFKRNKDGGCICKSARIYEKDIQENINIIAEGAISVNKLLEELIGLKADDFTRTVVLPQGKFSEFLTLQPKSRGEMLERILHLEEYGIELETKIKSEKAKIDKEIIVLDTKINAYEELAEENLIDEKNTYKILSIKIETLKTQKIEIEEEINLAKQVWELQQEKAIYEENYNEILKDKDKIQLQKHNLMSAQKADIIYPYIKSFEETENKLFVINKELDLKTIEYNNKEKQLEQKQLNYNKSKEIKDKEYEPLLKKEQNLKQAIDILNKVKVIEEEKQELQKKYKQLEIKQKNFRQQETEIKEFINKNKLELENTIINKEKLQVDTDYREEVEKAYQCENKYNDININVENISQKISTFNSSIALSEKQMLDLENKLQNIENEILEIDEQLNKLNENYKDANTLLELQNKHNKAKIDYNNIKDKEYKKQELEKKSEEISISNREYQQDFDIKSDQSKEYTKNLEKLQQQLKTLEILNSSAILAEVLEQSKPCPVCGSTHHPYPAKRLKTEINSDLEQKIKIVQKQCLDIQNELNKLSTNLAITNKEHDKIISELSNIQQEIGTKTAEQLLRQEKELKQEFEVLKEEIETWDKQKKEKEKLYKQKNDIKNELTLEKTRILERCNNDIKNKSEQELEHKNYIQEQKDLYDNLIRYKQNLGIGNFSEERKIILYNEKEYKRFEILEKQLRQKINSNEEQRNKITDELIIVEKDMNKVFEIGSEKANTIKAYNTDIEVLSENNEPKQYILIVRNKIDEICTMEKTLHDELNNIQLEKQKLINECNNIKNQQDTLSELKLKQYDDLQNQLIDNDFIDYQQVREVLISKDIQNNMQEIINKYEENYKTVLNNIERLTKKLLGRTIEQNKWENINEKSKEITDQLDQSNQNIAVTIEKIKTMEYKLKDLNNLKKQKDKAEHRLDLLKQLIDLIKGKAFVKFVAKRQMKYITKEATKYLKKITKDRYAIEMDDDDDFIMRDDFSGGIRRKPNTLSGGELFVTSLALSLALSSQIQLKNKAPLEFFFLDEGFGSLDMELLDVVINSLEKLHSEHMHIGIISHVEELKNRISVKLIVTPAQQGLHGSKISLELT